MLGSLHSVTDCDRKRAAPDGVRRSLTSQGIWFADRPNRAEYDLDAWTSSAEVVILVCSAVSGPSVYACCLAHIVERRGSGNAGTPRQMSVGSDYPRVDGVAKLGGAARYVDDLSIPGILHGAVVRSPTPRGRIKRVRFDPAVNWDEFVVVDHHDIPGENVIALIERDQPALASSEFRHRHEPIVLLAHRSIHRLRDAVRAVSIEFDALPSVMHMRQPLTPELVQYGDDNVFKRIDICKGNPASPFSNAAHVIEGEYVTGSQEHVYLEPQGMVAYREGEKLIVQGSMQCPYYVLSALRAAFGRPAESFRVIQTPVGGGFGGKEEYPSVLAVHAALLAEKAGAPVKIIYDRQEDMAVTTKRHPSWTHHKTAVSRDGRLLAMEIEVLLDGGAYVTLSPVVLSRGTIHAAGPYHCEHIHIHGEARLTNAPPYGAFRGFGAPQTLFAVERHMDVIAKTIGIEPAEFRRRNLLRGGQQTATGQIVRDGTDLVSIQDRALTLASYDARRKEHASIASSGGFTRRGIGFATFYHGAGFTGAGEVHLASEVWVEGLPDGTIEVLTAQTDMGQGTTTILTQIVADRLGLNPDGVRIATPDTSRVPNSGPTVASRTAMVVGRLLEQACDDLATQAGHADARGAILAAAIRSWHAANPSKRLIGVGKYVKPGSIQWDEVSYRGDAYADYSWATHVAEVEVDLRTYSVRVVDYAALQEIGRVLNPTLACGQIQGGVVQGIGWALTEDVVLEDGAMKNSQMTNYIIPGSADVPPIRVYFDERISPYGPSGAKGIGELPIDGPAPAVINAVCNALDVSICEIPLTPEKLMVALEGKTHG